MKVLDYLLKLHLSGNTGGDTPSNDLLEKIILECEKNAPVRRVMLPFNFNTGKMPYKIGFSANLLNNQYNYCRIARKMGVEAYLFLNPEFQDTLPTAMPFWDEMTFEVSDFNDKSLEQISRAFQSPPWISSVLRDMGLSVIYREKSLPDAERFLNSFGYVFNSFSLYDYYSYHHVVPYLELVKLYNSMDINQVSGLHVAIAGYSQKPYVTHLYGSDIYGIPFRENLFGSMQARGMKKADLHISEASAVLDCLCALGIPKQNLVKLPMPIDTDFYSVAPPHNDEVPDKYRGKHLLSLVARQNWKWKGNDLIFKAIKLLSKKRDDFICPVIWYGQDLEKSQKLIKDLGISHLIEKKKIMSKKALINLFSLSTVIIDQFTTGIFGTSVLEALSCGKPVINHYEPKLLNHDSPAPVLNAKSSEELYEILDNVLDDLDKLAETGRRSRQWIEENYCYRKIFPLYEEQYHRVLHNKRTIEQA